MTNASNFEDHAEHLSSGPGWRRSLPIKWVVAITALLGVGVLAAACGGSTNPGSGTGSSSGGLAAQGVAFTRCMRSHGVSNFPDPTLSSGGGVTFQGSFNLKSPTYQAADKACQSLMPSGAQAPPASAQKLAAEVKWAQCIRTHGVPSFPDPNAQGAIDSSEFDPTSSAFQTASRACQSLQPTGAISAVPGHGPG
jgi:hypothetical protein